MGILTNPYGGDLHYLDFVEFLVCYLFIGLFIWFLVFCFLNKVYKTQSNLKLKLLPPASQMLALQVCKDTAADLCEL